LDCCCQADAPPIWFKMKLIDFKNKKEIEIIVEKKGGDNAKLHSPQVHFVTDALKADEEAQVFMKKYFHFQMSHPNSIICIGKMSIVDIDFEDDTAPDETNLICHHHQTDGEVHEHKTMHVNREEKTEKPFEEEFQINK